MFCASTASAEILRLDRAIVRALSANPSLAAAAAAELEARERRRVAEAGWFPRLELHEGWQRGNQPVFVFGSLLTQRRFTESNFAVNALTRPDPLDNFRAAVTIAQPLFDGGRARAAVQGADAGVSLAEAVRRDAAGEVAVAVARAYAQALAADASTRAAEAAIETAIADLARARARGDQGLATEADVLAIEVHLAEVRARQIAAAADARIARAALNRLMDTELDDAWDLVDETPPAAPADDETAVLGGRPDLAVAARRVDAADAEARGARAALLARV